VEEWFHGHNYLDHVPPSQWDQQDSRVEANTDLCLALLEQYGVQATFFVLGWIADRHPDLVRRISEAGHEIGCHSYGHPILFRLTEEEFVADLDQALAALKRAGVHECRCYRAPSFSLTPAVHHFLPLLAERGIRIDCSLFPIHHPRYGQPATPRRPFLLEGTVQNPFTVLPMTTVRMAGLNIPFSGGGYMRLLPERIYRSMRRRAWRQNVPVILYVHPWELDSFRPQVGLSPWNRWRSQGGQNSMPAKLAAILSEGRFQTVGDYIETRLVAGDLPVHHLKFADDFAN